MKNILLVFLLFYSLNGQHLHAQDSLVYPTFFSMMEADQPISHISYPFVHNFLKSASHKSRHLPLEESEGGDGFVAEPSLDLTFPLIQGKKGGRPFWNTFSIGLNYGFNTRIVKTNSSPILPPTNRFGITIDKVLFETVSGTSWFPWSFRTDLTPVMPRAKENIQILYFSFSLEHYSNGQNGSIFKPNPITGNDENRNNYMNGDFSTNFARFNLTYSNLHKSQTRLFTASLGLQFEIGSDDGLFAFFEEQEHRYGKLRVLSMLQYRFPIINEFHEIRLRLENRLILCDCEAYPYYPERYLNGTSLFFEYNPLKLRTLGFLLHFYRGRDYLNIRYDDPIFIGHIGFTISQKKYKPINKLTSILY